jgi:restriction endonuclease S subunit
MGQLKGAQLPRIGWSSFAELQIPLPPMEVQKEIVAEIEGYQKVIDGARAVLDNYRPHIPIHPDWPIVELESVFKLASGRGLTQANMEEGPYPVYGGNGKTGTHSEFFLDTPNIVIGRVGAYCGAVHITEPKAWITDNALYITEFKQEFDLGYLAQMLAQLNLNQFAKVGGQPSISQSTVYEQTIPLPPLATQRAIVAEIEAEQALVAANRELIARFEKKIQATLARVWGEESAED